MFYHIRYFLHYLFLFPPPINALLLNALNEGLLETLLENVGVLGRVNPLSLLDNCTQLLKSVWSPLRVGEESDDGAMAIDAIPLLGVTLVPEETVIGIDGGGIIEVD